MTATLNDVAKKAGEPSAEQQAAAELVRLAKEQGLSLTGPDGLLKQLTRTVLAFLAAAARAGGAAELSWHVTFNHDGKVNRLSYRSDNERTPGWYVEILCMSDGQAAAPFLPTSRSWAAQACRTLAST